MINQSSTNLNQPNNQPEYTGTHTHAPNAHTQAHTPNTHEELSQNTLFFDNSKSGNQI
jgi:hypothetical protein